MKVVEVKGKQIGKKVEPEKGGKDMVEELLMKVHKIGHWGATAMFKHITMVLDQAHIPHLMKRCTDFVRECGPCLQVTNFKVAFAPPRKPVEYTPMQYVHMDLLEMTEESVLGHKFILVVIDQFSGFVILRPISQKSAKEVGYEIYKVFLEWGFPAAVKSDNGKEFCNEIVKECVEFAGAKRFITVAHDHHANGLVERANRTIRSIMERFIRDGDKDRRRGY